MWVSCSVVVSESPQFRSNVAQFELLMLFRNTCKSPPLIVFYAGGWNAAGMEETSA